MSLPTSITTTKPGMKSTSTPSTPSTATPVSTPTRVSRSRTFSSVSIGDAVKFKELKEGEMKNNNNFDANATNASTFSATETNSTTRENKSISEELTPLSKLFKEGTKDAHSDAEKSVFVKKFLVGKLPQRAYVHYISRLYFVYRTLEDAIRRNSLLCGSEALEAGKELIYFPELEREEALGKDLAFVRSF